jgi:hypothetical protein
MGRQAAVAYAKAAPPLAKPAVAFAKDAAKPLYFY